MVLQKLQTADAFVVRDLDPETPAIGIVRSARKILQGGAKELARSQTYQCAALQVQHQGASAGVNALPEAADEAMAAFAAELLPAVESGTLMLDPGKGVTAKQLAPLAAADNRSGARLRDISGVANQDHLTATGAVACAAVARDLDGARVAIENFDSAGAAIAQMVAAAGAKVVAVSTAAGSATSADGFSVESLTAGLSADGAAFVSALSDEESPSWKILGAEADILFAGSKMGLIDHTGAPNIKASVLVPTGSIPYTTKGALLMERQGCIVLPDFVTTGGGLLAALAAESDDQASLETQVTDRLASLTESILNKDASPILEACFLAETVLKTWREKRPFGRPFAP